MKSNSKISHLFGIVITALLFAFSGNAQENNKIGNWSGKIKLPAMQLEMIFKISEDEEGRTQAKLDVPAQGGKDITAEIVKSSEDSINIKVAAIVGTYKGIFYSSDSIIGKWSQSGTSLPLNLKRIEKLPEIKRPQTPKPPFSYLSEEVEYINPKSGLKLAGTLTLPENAKNCPVVILISGSGAQDRDETIFNHKLFWVIADYFAKNGIAVLRVDDRGVGDSEGNISEATSEDFAGDVLAGVNYLKSNDKIDASKIGLIGHSEGGIIAPIAATTSSDISFIILMAGPGVIGKEILIEQSELLNRAGGLSESAISQNQMIVKAMVDILCNEKDSVKALDRLQRTLSGGMYPMMDDERKKLIDAQVSGVNTNWFRFFLSYDPYQTLTRVQCPVLAFIGEKDLQVPAKTNLKAIQNALNEGGNKNFKTIEFPNLNHLFQNCETGAASEYAQIEETIEPEVLEIMRDWILELVKK